MFDTFAFLNMLIALYSAVCLFFSASTGINVTDTHLPALVRATTADLEIKPAVALAAVVADGYGYGYAHGHGYGYEHERKEANHPHQIPAYSTTSYPQYIPTSCYGRPPGYHGDPAFECKQFKLCQSDGRMDVFYCPENTKFNNYLSICDWPDQVDTNCNPVYSMPQYYLYEMTPSPPANTDQYPDPLTANSINPQLKPAYEKKLQTYVPRHDPPQYFVPKFHTSTNKGPAPDHGDNYGKQNEPSYDLKFQYSYKDLFRFHPALYADSDYESDYRLGYDTVYDPAYNSPYLPYYLTKRYFS